MPHIFNTRLPHIASAFVKALQVPVTATVLKDAIQSHPHYPSLLSLSNTLSKFKIENAALEAGPAELNQFIPPFIAYYAVGENGNDFVLVTGISDEIVSYIYSKKSAVTVDRDTFNKHFKKAVLLAEASPESGDRNFAGSLKKEKKQQQKKYFSYMAAAVCLIAAGFGFFNAAYLNAAAAVPIFSTKLLGAAITILLVIYETDRSNTFVKDICTAGAKTNCDAVLGSKAAVITGISWSEAGCFYFSASFLFLLLPGTAFAEKIPWLGMAAMAAAPFIIFSIYYQYKIIRQWCPLCLAVQAVLAAELIWAVLQYSRLKHPQFSIAAAIPGVVLLVLAIVIWYALKPLLTAVKPGEQYKYAYRRLLYNPAYFNSLLQEQPAAPPGWQQTGITIGNPQAPHTIIKVCNPFCGPCAGAHPKLESIIDNNSNYNIKIIFTATNREGDKGAPVVRHLLAVQAQGNPLQTRKAVDDWYSAGQKDYKVFAAKYPVPDGLQQYSAAIDEMSNWCRQAEIAYTPTIFINGRRMPGNYEIDELKNVL